MTESRATEGTLAWTADRQLEGFETATLEFITTIVGSDGKKCAVGTTTHALTDLDGVLQFQLPPLIAERVNRLLAWMELP